MHGIVQVRHILQMLADPDEQIRSEAATNQRTSGCRYTAAEPLSALAEGSGVRRAPRKERSDPTYTTPGSVAARQRLAEVSRTLGRRRTLSGDVVASEYLRTMFNS